MKDTIIALVGRPNVGKSTLFNRLAINKKAIVHDKPGVTRDRKYANAKLGPIKFTVIDTPGLEEAQEDKIEHKMMQQTLLAIKEADLVCLVVDGRIGITPTDKIFADLVRKNSKNYILVVNKCEKDINFSNEYYRLGFKAMINISAEHNIGMMNLYEAITGNLSEQEDPINVIKEIQIDDTIRIAIVGRPNVGKSTFINALIKEQRLLTGPISGTTRESIEIKWQHQGRQIELIDTAGLRRKKAVNEKLEQLSVSDAINTINFANTVILMLSAENPLEQQDLIIANHVIKEGRSLVIVINKADLIKDRKQFKEEFEYKLSTHLPQVKNVPVIFISAIKAGNIAAVLDEAIKIYDIWNKKISTGRLNNWLERVCNEHPLPLQKNGRRIKLKYMTQIKIRPPTFKLFANDPSKISDSYQKYLINSMRDKFDIPGVPIRLVFVKNKNPYAS